MEGEVVLVVVMWEKEGREMRLLVFSRVLVMGVELPVAGGEFWSTSSAISSSESSSSWRLREMVEGGGRGRGELVCACRSWTHCSR